MKKYSWKTTASGIGAILAAIGPLVFALTKREPITESIWTVAVAGVLSGLGLMFARDNNRTSEDVGAEDAVKPDATKVIPRGSLPPTLLWLALTLTLVGCSTVTTPPTDGNGNANSSSNQLARIEAVCRIAAATGAQIDLTDNPQRRAYYVAANETLAAMIKDEDWNSARFISAMQDLPVKELKGSNAALLITTAVILWEETGAVNTANQPAYVRAFTLGVHRGLTDALNNTTKG